MKVIVEHHPEFGMVTLKPEQGDTAITSPEKLPEKLELLGVGQAMPFGAEAFLTNAPIELDVSEDDWRLVTRGF